MTTTAESPPEPNPWPVDAPQARLGALLLMGMSVNHVGEPHDSKHPDAVEGGSHLRKWAVYCIKVGEPGDRDRFALIGDLFICTGRWHVQVGAMTILQLREHRLEQALASSSQDLTDIYGPWGVHILWDYISERARTLGDTVHAGLDLPFKTPVTRYVVPTHLQSPPDADETGSDRAEDSPLPSSDADS